MRQQAEDRKSERERENKRRSPEESGHGETREKVSIKLF